MDFLPFPCYKKVKMCVRQKEPPKAFCKKRFSEKLCNIYRKTPVPESLIKKKTLAQVFSCKFCKISKNNFFTEHLWATG